MKNDIDESESDDSSVEGGYSVAGFDSPRFDFTSWNPEPPAGLHFMCLIPIGRPYPKTEEINNTPGKIRVSQTHRQQRLKEFKNGRTNCRNILDERKLRSAASRNEYPTVLDLLENGVDPHAFDEKKRTALHFAASQGHQLIVKILLDKGADVNQTDVLGNTPLHLAACTSQVPIVTLLLKAGPDLHQLNKYGTTPFSLARSKLKFLADSRGYSSTRVKDEVAQVSEMMKTYMDLSGLKNESQQVEDLCQQLQRTSTREEVDSITSLLAGFTNMNLKKESL